MFIVPVTKGDADLFRRMLVEYWRDLVPDAPWLQDPILAEAHFKDRYRWDGGGKNPFWALVDGRRVGFFMVRIYEDDVTAYIHDFFIDAVARRQGLGTEMFRELLSLLQNRGIVRINLSVLADNPVALNFWREQGFEIAYHRLTKFVDSVE
ncbi:MAG: GNAT family N-acetyltransferase [Candidatus Promineifilaceae bacterium]